MRSRTGCLTCRQRKLKCDEVRPVCGQCQKANRHCEPSTGITFRHQHNASMNASSPSGAQSPLNGFYAYKDTFDQDVHWVAIPRELKFCHIRDPYSEDPSSSEVRDIEYTGAAFGALQADRLQALWNSDPQLGHGGTTGLNTHGLEALSAAALSGVNAPQASMVPRPRSSTAEPGGKTRTSNAASTAGDGGSSTGNIDYILNPPGTTTSAEQPIDPTLIAARGSEGLASPGAAQSEGTPLAVGATDSEQKMDLLLKSLSQSPGQEQSQRAEQKGEGD